MSEQTDTIRLLGKVKKIGHNNLSIETDNGMLIDVLADCMELVVVLLAESDHNNEVFHEANEQANRLRNLWKEKFHKSD